MSQASVGGTVTHRFETTLVLDPGSEGLNSAGDTQQTALQEGQGCILSLSSLQHRSTQKVLVAARVAGRLVPKSRS